MSEFNKYKPCDADFGYKSTVLLMLIVAADFYCKRWINFRRCKLATPLAAFAVPVGSCARDRVSSYPVFQCFVSVATRTDAVVGSVSLPSSVAAV